MACAISIEWETYMADFEYRVVAIEHINFVFIFDQHHIAAEESLLRSETTIIRWNSPCSISFPTDHIWRLYNSHIIVNIHWYWLWTGKTSSTQKVRFDKREIGYLPIPFAHALTGELNRIHGLLKGYNRHSWKTDSKLWNFLLLKYKETVRILLSLCKGNSLLENLLEIVY